jgi:hypothetical protein
MVQRRTISMEEARDLLQLKQCVSLWGLRENRRESQRYKVNIKGHYYIDQKEGSTVRDLCMLVDVSRSGVSIWANTVSFNRGAVLHLQFQVGLQTVNVAGRVVHIGYENGGSVVGVKSLSRKIDITSQLLAE